MLSAKCDRKRLQDVQKHPREARWKTQGPLRAISTAPGEGAIGIVRLSGARGDFHCGVRIRLFER